MNHSRYLRNAAAFLRAGNPLAAELLAEKAVEDPALAEAWLVLGIARAKRLRHADAAPCFLRVLELQPNNIDAWTDLGEVYLALGRYDGAAAALKQAITLDPNALHPSGRRARAVVGRTYALLKKNA